TAPTNWSTGLPSTKAHTFGIDITRNCCAVRWFASTSSLARRNSPSFSSAILSRIGPSVLHGWHQSAQKSTTTGRRLDSSMTASAKSASVTSTTTVEESARCASTVPHAFDLSPHGLGQLERALPPAYRVVLPLHRDGGAELDPDRHALEELRTLRHGLVCAADRRRK